jgi:diguanylate cyclase
MDLSLARLAQSVTGAQDLEGLTRPLLELLESVTGLESTYLTTVDPQRGLQHILYSRNTKTLKIPEGLSVPWEDTLCKRALDENRPYTDDVASCWGDSTAARALGIQTYLSQPVRDLHGALYGTLCAASGSRLPVSPDTVRILGLFALLIGRQVDREHQLEELRKTNQELATGALSDPLTGIANRRSLTQDLRRLLAQAQRDHSRIHVAFVDLDGFKAINDRYGHEAGDRFLIQVASRLVSGTRAGDLVARYGGDEFVVITTRAVEAEFKARIESLLIGRYALGDSSFDYGGASVGVISSDAGETNVDQLLARADTAMYEIKKARKHPAPAGAG